MHFFTTFGRIKTEKKKFQCALTICTALILSYFGYWPPSTYAFRKVCFTCWTQWVQSIFEVLSEFLCLWNFTRYLNIQKKENTLGSRFFRTILLSGQQIRPFGVLMLFDIVVSVKSLLTELMRRCWQLTIRCQTAWALVIYLEEYLLNSIRSYIWLTCFNYQTFSLA